jgi:hypothetical protein
MHVLLLSASSLSLACLSTLDKDANESVHKLGQVTRHVLLDSKSGQRDIYAIHMAPS